jgi:peptidoglycan/LPS O-acetylase OafA/YrhL
MRFFQVSIRSADCFFAVRLSFWFSLVMGVCPLAFAFLAEGLAIEEQFYLVWPAVVALLSGRALRRLVLAILVGSPLLRMALASSGVGPYSLQVSSFTHLDALAAGALLALSMRERSPLVSKRWATWWILTGASSFVILAVLMGTPTPIYSVQMALMLSSAAALWGGVVGLCVAAPTSVGARVAGCAPLRVLGKYSYAFYLFHLPVAAVLSVAGLDRQTVGRYGFFSLTVSTTLLLAVASWHLWEKHWLALKDRFPRLTAQYFSAP